MDAGLLGAEENVELTAILVPASAGPAMLDAVVAQLEKTAPIGSAA